MTTESRDRSAVERHAQRDLLIVVAIVAGSLLVIGLLSLALIVWLEAIAFWDSTAVEETFRGSAGPRRWRSS